MKILVTGAAGFIGFHTVSKFLSSGHEITGLDNINDYYDVGLKYERLQQHGIDQDAIAYGKVIPSSTYSGYQFTQFDLSDKEGIAALFEQYRFEGVINLAAQAGVRYSLTNPHIYVQSNVAGFLNILEGCRSVNTRHLVYASTSSVYGLNEHMPLSVHEPTEHPITLYAATKKANEMMAHSYSHLFGIPTTGIRFFTVYGPWGRPDMALFLFTDAILNDRPIKVFNNGEMIRDFTYVDDIVAGIEHIFNKPATPMSNWNPLQPDSAGSSAPYRVVNIGNSQPVKLLDYISALEESLGKKAIKEFLPMQPGDVPATHADVNDLITEYNYRPKVDVREGVKRFVDWYKQYYELKV